MGFAPRHERSGRQIATVAVWVVLWGLLVAQTCPSPIQYFYDSMGRLTAVIRPPTQGADQNVAVYHYDQVGNVTQIERYRADQQIHVLAFTPACGPTGTSVSIFGTDFGANPASNQVLFGTTAATISSATTTQIVASAPTGGILKVRNLTKGTEATSATAFSATTCIGPVITSLAPTPLRWAAGQTVTINGLNFATTLGDNLIAFNGETVVPATATATQLTAVLPANVTSGRVRVTTPQGTALSADTYFIVPSGYTSDQIDAAITMVLPAQPAAPPDDKTGTITGAGRLVLFAFEAPGDAKATLKFTITPTGFIALTDPNGDTVPKPPVTIGSTYFGVRLSHAGTYLLRFTQFGPTQTGNVRVQLYRADDVLGTMTLSPTGDTETATFAVDGQDARYGFEASVDDRVSVTRDAITIGSVVYQNLLDPFGGVMAQEVNNITGPATVATGGTHYVFIDPVNLSVGSTTITLWKVPPNSTGQSVMINGPSVPVTIQAPGQNPEVALNGTGTNQAVTVGFTLNSANFSGYAPGCVTVQVLAGAPPGQGTPLGSSSGCGTSGSVGVTLPTPGAYTISIDHSGAARGGPINLTATSP